MHSSLLRSSMVQDQIPKVWLPARFAHGSVDGLGDAPHQYDVIILNNPLKNSDLLVALCSKGMHHLGARVSGLMAHRIHQLGTLCVLMAEQMN